MCRWHSVLRYSFVVGRFAREMAIDIHAVSAAPSKNETKTIGWIGESGTRILPFYYFLLLYRTSNEPHYVLLLLLWRYHLYAFDHFAWIARHALPFVHRIFDSVYALRAELNDNSVRAVHVECGDAHTIARNRINDVRVIWMCIRISSSIFRSFFGLVCFRHYPRSRCWHRCCFDIEYDANDHPFQIKRWNFFPLIFLSRVQHSKHIYMST